MLRLREPSPDSLQRFLDDQRRHDFSYEAVGATATNPPKGYVVDHTRNKLGSGEETFLAAKAALACWQQLRLGWVEAWPSETPIQRGEVVAVIARTAGFWWLNACKIVYLIDEAGSLNRFGFAYGTLPVHAQTGEERFLIEWDQAQGDVWYDILAFSRPRHVLAKLGYPFVRRTQKKFGRDSAAAMKRMVAAGVGAS
jgi:uncharacterized protein (UPF0548 family)